MKRPLHQRLGADLPSLLLRRQNPREPPRGAGAAPPRARRRRAAPQGARNLRLPIDPRRMAAHQPSPIPWRARRGRARVGAHDQRRHQHRLLARALGGEGDERARTHSSPPAPGNRAWAISGRWAWPAVALDQLVEPAGMPFGRGIVPPRGELAPVRAAALGARAPQSQAADHAAVRAAAIPRGAHRGGRRPLGGSLAPAHSVRTSLPCRVNPQHLFGPRRAGYRPSGPPRSGGGRRGSAAARSRGAGAERVSARRRSSPSRKVARDARSGRWRLEFTALAPIWRFSCCSQPHGPLEMPPPLGNVAPDRFAREISAEGSIPAVVLPSRLRQRPQSN